MHNTTHTCIQVLNNGLCPNWHTVGPEDPECGRLPWIFNVEASHYMDYHALQVGRIA